MINVINNQPTTSSKGKIRKVVQTISFLRQQYFGSYDLVAQAKLALLSPSSLRSGEDKDKIQRLMSRYSFFIGLKQQYGPVIFHDFCEKLYLKRYEKGQEVIRISQEGETFYVILSGKVGISIYQPRAAQSSLTIQQPQDQDDQFVQVEINQLKQGESFGELALVEYGSRTTATVTTKEDCEFACLDRDHYWDTIGRLKQDELYNKLDFLKSLPFLKGWYEQDLKTLNYHFKPLKLKKRQVLYERGEKACGIYIVREGEIEIWGQVKQRGRLMFDEADEFLNDCCKPTKEILICRLASGNLLGEEELVDQPVRQYRAVCGSLTAEVFTISRHELDQRLWFGNSKQILYKMAFQRSNYRSSYQHKLENLQFLKARKKEEDVERIEHLYQQRDRVLAKKGLVMSLRKESIQVPIPEQTRVIQRIEMKTKKYPPKIDFFEAFSNLGRSYSIDLMPVKYIPQKDGRQMIKQWTNLDCFQRAQLLGLKPKRQMGLDIVIDERAKQVTFRKSIERLRQTYYQVDPSQPSQQRENNSQPRLRMLDDPLKAFGTPERSERQLSEIQIIDKLQDCLPLRIHSKKSFNDNSVKANPKLRLKLRLDVNSTGTPSLSRLQSRSQHTQCYSSRPPTSDRKASERTALILPEFKCS